MTLLAPADGAKIFAKIAAPHGAADVEGFGRRPIEEVRRVTGAVVGKPSENEPAGMGVGAAARTMGILAWCRLMWRQQRWLAERS